MIDTETPEGMKLCAYDILELRFYGAPGETRRRILYIEHYSPGDLAYLLEAAKGDGGIDGACKTLSITPLYARI